MPENYTSLIVMVVVLVLVCAVVGYRALRARRRKTTPDIPAESGQGRVL